MEVLMRETLFWGDCPEYIVYFSIFISVVGLYLLKIMGKKEEGK